MVLALVFSACNKDLLNPSNVNDDAVLKTRASSSELITASILKAEFEAVKAEYKGSAKVTIAEGITLEKVKSNDHELVFGDVPNGTITLYVKNGNIFTSYTFVNWSNAKYTFSGKEVSGLKYGEFEIAHDCAIDGHVMELIETVAADCINRGYDLYECKFCDHKYWDYTANALGHNFVPSERNIGIFQRANGTMNVEYICDRDGCPSYPHYVWLIVDALLADIALAEDFLAEDFSAYTDASVEAAKAWVNNSLDDLLSLKDEVINNYTSDASLRASLDAIDIVESIEYARSLLVVKPTQPTPAEVIAAITDAINDAIPTGGNITALVVVSNNTSSITLTIDGVDYTFTGGGGANSDKSCTINGVRYIITIQANGARFSVRQA